MESSGKSDTVHFGRCGHGGELKSDQLYGIDLCCGFGGILYQCTSPSLERVPENPVQQTLVPTT